MERIELFETVYQLSQDKRSLERHAKVQESAKRKIGYSQEISILQSSVSGKQEFLVIADESEDALQEKITNLENEVGKLVSNDELNAIQKDSFRRLRQFLRERRNFQKSIEQISREISELERRSKEEKLPSRKEVLVNLVNKFAQVKEKLTEEFEQTVFVNPESFMAYTLLLLRNYQNQLPSGIVETEYPKTQKERAKKLLAKNRLIAFLGETGTGKTRIAEKLAQELSGSYEFIPGHKFITKEEIFSYLGIKAIGVEPDQVPSLIEHAQENKKNLKRVILIWQKRRLKNILHILKM